MKVTKNNRAHRGGGFTIVEMIIVVVIIGIAAMIAVPSLSSAADMQARSAANIIAADLDYAKSMAVTHQTGHAVVFDVSANAYEIRRDPYGSGDVVNNPLLPGSPYRVSFANNRTLNRVDVTGADFDSDISETITFDYLGSPYSGAGTTPANALNSGQVTVQAGDFTVTVDIEPVTGYVTINGL